jgi:hypothetical protein
VAPVGPLRRLSAEALVRFRTDNWHMLILALFAGDFSWILRMC